MKLTNIKTEALMQEIIDRCSDQLADPEPQFDDVLTFLSAAELDWVMGELSDSLAKRKVRVGGGYRK